MFDPANPPSTKRRRERLPVTTWGPKETKKLYDRFHVMRWKALKDGQSFAWTSFKEFLAEIAPLLPEDYVPSSYRMRFETGEKGEDGQPLGYCLATMKVLKSGGDVAAAARREIREAREKRQRLTENMTGLLIKTSEESAELTLRVLEEEVDLADL